jgi:hypothetical protein
MLLVALKYWPFYYQVCVILGASSAAVEENRPTVEISSKPRLVGLNTSTTKVRNGLAMA